MCELTEALEQIYRSLPTSPYWRGYAGSLVARMCLRELFPVERSVYQPLLACQRDHGQCWDYVDALM